MNAVDTGLADPKIVGFVTVDQPSRTGAAWDAKDNKDVERHISKAPTGIDHDTISNYYRLMKLKLTRHMSGKSFWRSNYPPWASMPLVKRKMKRRGGFVCKLTWRVK